MSARVMWRGVIELGRHTIPVRLFAAAEDRTVHFRMLHRQDRQPVRQRLIHPETGDEVAAEEVRKGAELDRGVFVLLDDDELTSLEPEPSRSIIVERVVANAELDHFWYDRPYYLGPDGDDKAYGSLVKVLADKSREAVVRWVMRGKEYVGSITVHDGRLALIALRFADEVVGPQEIHVPPQAAFPAGEVAMANQLISTLASTFDPGQFHDTFNEEVRELIEQKARGRTVAAKKARRKQAPRSLEKALRDSLAAARTASAPRPTRSAKGKAKPARRKEGKRAA
jgi:DNA end-binding protein Ku